MTIKEQIQYDLDAGRFGQICSNENTFTAYVFGKIDKIHDDLLAVADAGELEDLRREVEYYFGTKKKPKFI